MSAEAFAPAPQGVLSAWETEKQIYFGKIAPGTTSLTRPIAAPGAANERKHPALAGNSQGEVLLVWTEGTGWDKGGALAWCIFDKDGKPTRETGRVDRG